MRGCKSLPLTVSYLSLMPSAFSASGPSFLRINSSQAGTKSFQRSQCTSLCCAKAGALPVAKMAAMPPVVFRNLRLWIFVIHFLPGSVGFF